jgi:hypothetical protein
MCSDQQRSGKDSVPGTRRKAISHALTRDLPMNFSQLMPTPNEVLYKIDAYGMLLASALRRRGKER